MKTIDVEKALHLAGALDLKEVVMKDNFLYRQEQDGIRCLGPFYLRGRYTTLDGEKDFQDVFEFDVFAANEKLDGEEFKIAFDDYDYTLQDGITLTLHFQVYGICDEPKEETVKEIYEPCEPMEEEKAKEEEEETIPTSSECSTENEVDFSMMEELFDEKDNVITSYSFVVVKNNDTYESIANRYHVDVEALRRANEDKVIHEKSLVVLPYAK